MARDEDRMVVFMNSFDQVSYGKKWWNNKKRPINQLKENKEHTFESEAEKGGLKTFNLPSCTLHFRLQRDSLSLCVCSSKRLK